MGNRSLQSANGTLKVARQDSIVGTLKSHWHPQPPARPRVDPDLTDLPAVERAAETLRYSLLRGEYWVSPGGTLREWLRFNLWFAVFAAIPAFIVGPVLTVLFTEVAGWSALLLATAVNILHFLLTLIAIAALVSGAFYFLRFAAGSGRPRR